MIYHVFLNDNQHLKLGREKISLHQMLWHTAKMFDLQKTCETAIIILLRSLLIKDLRWR